MLTVPKEITNAIGWCMIISCIGWWIRNLISFVIDEDKTSLITKIAGLFSRGRNE